MNPADVSDFLTFGGVLAFLAFAAAATLVRWCVRSVRAKTTRMDEVLTWADCPCRTGLHDCGVAEHRTLSGYDVSRWVA